MGRVEGRVALITGSTYGIGEAIARVLAKEDALLYVKDNIRVNSVHPKFVTGNELIIDGGYTAS